MKTSTLYIYLLANKASRQKNEYFKVRLTVSSDPPPSGQPFVIFLGLLLTLYFMMICFLKRILHKKK